MTVIKASFATTQPFLDRVTLTGADHTASPQHLLALSARYPFVEWGLLWGGRGGAEYSRWPTIEWFRALHRAIEEAQIAGRPDPHLSLHLCPPILDRFIHDDGAQLPPVLMSLPFDRVQLNFHGQPVPSDLIDSLAVAVGDLGIEEIIVQCDGVNDGLVHALHTRLPHLIQGLFDRSHGGGVRPSAWPAAKGWAHGVGYAGGLGPEGLLSDLFAILDAAKGYEGRPLWIDMETRLFRHNGERTIFDLQRCEQVLDTCLPFVHPEP